MTKSGLSRARWASTSAAVLALTIAACGGGGGKGTTATTSSPQSPTTTAKAAVLGPERVPIPNGPALGPVKAALYPLTIDGIECQVSEQLVYHIHAHLTVFVDGQARQIPYGIGIAPPLQVTSTQVGDFVSGGTCFYWLHTHVADGIIHIESPTQKLYTLGQFFDVWGQPLAAGQVGPASGKLTIFVDGKLYTGDPRTIELTKHGEIQLDVGTVVPPQTIDWSITAL